jgi:serine/threonine-protein kinase
MVFDCIRSQIEVRVMNHLEPLRSTATSDTSRMGAGTWQAGSPRPGPDGSGRAGPATFGRADSFLTDADLDPALAELAEEITQRLQAGETVDVDDYAARHPEWADPIRRLMPVLREMADLGQSSARDHDAGQLQGLHDGTSVEGRVLGDFRIIREVGRGGMGVVYEAEQLSLGRPPG